MTSDFYPRMNMRMKDGSPDVDNVHDWNAKTYTSVEYLSADEHEAILVDARAEAFELVEFIYRGQTCPMRLVEVYDRLRRAAREKK